MAGEIDAARNEIDQNPAPCGAQSTPRAFLVVTRGDGAQDCPDATQLSEQVRAIAGTNVVGVGLASPVETWIQVTMTRSFSSYGAQISALGAHHGTRSLEDLGPSCTSLADAVAVTIAIFLDPYANVPLPEPRALVLRTLERLRVREHSEWRRTGGQR